MRAYEAADSGNAELARELQLELVASLAMTNAAYSQILDVLRQVVARASVIGTQGATMRNKVELADVFRQANQDLIDAADASLSSLAIRIRQIEARILDGLLSVPQKRASTGLPMDSEGNVKPKARTIPKRIRDQEMPLDNVLLAAATLLHVTGDSSLEKKHPSAYKILGAPEADIDSRVLRSSWSPYARRIGIPIRSTVSGFIGSLRHGLGASISYLKGILGLKTGDGTRGIFGSPTEPLTGLRGVGRRFQQFIRDQAVAILGDERKDFQDGTTYLAGYVLRSVFANNTAPSHAARDGARFYRDDREGSYGSWAARLIPPYERSSCLCFTTDILDDVTDPEFTAEWSATPLVHGVEPRDVKTYAEWFSVQRPGIKNTIVGDKRWTASLTRNQTPVYSDFVRPNGQWMNHRSILNESAVDRLTRKQLVDEVVERQSALNQQSLKDGTNRYSLTGNGERQYRRRLFLFLQRELGEDAK